ncbi:hypothetical protein [Streptomyces sp. NPDC047453]|uniref:hypothetical protein n=1 Tax=Streptomyces sp. NPDC047453 TaxID=3154812 RepID=UPI0033F883D2
MALFSVNLAFFAAQGLEASNGQVVAVRDIAQLLSPPAECDAEPAPDTLRRT